MWGPVHSGTPFTPIVPLVVPLATPVGNFACGPVPTHVGTPLTRIVPDRELDLRPW